MDHAQPLALSRARRLAGMGLAEIGFRTRQESAKWLDRMTLDGASIDAAATLRRHAPALGEEALTKTLRERFEARFFAGTSPDAFDTIVNRFPTLALDIIAEADSLLEKRFDLLGYKQLSFGDPIDWHFDPVHDRRAPLVHWSRINPLDPRVCGDSKIVWELSRHQWVVRLAQAHAVTRDERYAQAALDAIDGWLEANPKGFGINWASSLEVAFRVIAWTWVLALLRHSASLTDDAAGRIVASIHAHAHHVARYLSQYFSPNTHLTGEALGLVYAGTLFPEFDDAARWQQAGLRTLIDQATRQITTDGVYFEQSTCYQRYSCEIYLHLLLLAGRSNLAVPAPVTERLMHMVEVLCALQMPNGRMPSIGDADGGRLLSLVPRGPADCGEVFATAAAYFDRPDFARAARTIAPEVVWLMGSAGADAFDRVHDGRPVAARSRIFTDGGYAVMADSRAAHQMIVDVGPLGAYGHGHADLLSIQCAVFGEPCLVDAGTGGYTPDPRWRDYFRGTSSHNTVTINRRGQAEPAGAFGWRTRPEARVHAWQSTSELDLVDADHDAYRDAGVRHRRRVLYIKPAFWIVVDDLEGTGSVTAEWSFQFAPVSVALDSAVVARAELLSGDALWVVPLATVDLQASVRHGDTHPIRGWISPDYGVRHPAPMLVYAAAADLPIRVITVLYPASGPAQDAPVIRAIGRDGIPTGVHVESLNLAVHFDSTPVVIERG